MYRHQGRTATLLASLAVLACSDAQQPNPAGAARSTPTADHALLAAHTPPPATGGFAALVVAPEYAGLDAARATATGGALRLEVDASGEVPRHPDAYIGSVAVFGYAWADLATGNGIVAVIHPVIGRDSRQNPTGWHTHTVLLAGGTTGTGGTSDFCIASLGRSQAGIAIHDDALQISMPDQWASVAAEEIDVAAAFVVQADAGCGATGLGVDLLDTADPHAP